MRCCSALVGPSRCPLSALVLAHPAPPFLPFTQPILAEIEQIAAPAIHARLDAPDTMRGTIADLGEKFADFFVAPSSQGGTSSKLQGGSPRALRDALYCFQLLVL